MCRDLQEIGLYECYNGSGKREPCDTSGLYFMNISGHILLLYLIFIALKDDLQPCNNSSLNQVYKRKHILKNCTLEPNIVIQITIEKSNID